MKKISKKEIQQSVNQSLLDVVNSLEINAPSKKTKKIIKKVSRKVSEELKSEIKKQFRTMKKASKSVDMKKSAQSLSA